MTDQPANKVKRWTYPFTAINGKEVEDPQAYFDALSRAQDGFYPLGVNGLWHGGVHFDSGTGAKLAQDGGICAIADGEVIAYRIDADYPKVEYADKKQALYSAGFVLIRHRLELPPNPKPSAPAAKPVSGTAPAASAVTPVAPEMLTFYSLYMHLLNWKTYQSDKKLKTPGFWTNKSTTYSVGERAQDRQSGGLEPSGTHWVPRFPTSRATADLSSAFRISIEDFIQSIRDAGGSVRISATRRPPERAYLMHYCWRIANEGMPPESVPPHEGINIDWTHLDANGNSDRSAAIKAASDMVSGYEIVHRPSLTSRHTEGRAIDMTITGIIGKRVADAGGVAIMINRLSDLNAVGSSYGVLKLLSDPPHWSDDGH